MWQVKAHRLTIGLRRPCRAGAISPDPTGTIPAHSGQIFTLSGMYGLRAMLRDVLEPTHGGDTLNVLSRKPALEAMFLRNFQPQRFRIYIKNPIGGRPDDHMDMRLVLHRPFNEPVPADSAIALQTHEIRLQHRMKFRSVRSACSWQCQGDSVRRSTQSMEIDGLQKLFVALT